MTLNELMNHLSGDRVVECITLSNGVELSVQASENHYCSPRQDEGPWSSVEVGISHQDYFRSRWSMEDAKIRNQFDLVAEDYWIGSWVSVKKVLDFINLCEQEEEE